MSTRWQIVAKMHDGRYGCIYVHCDGYPKYALRVLNDHYSSQMDVDSLIERGDCLSIGPTIGECETFAGRGEDWDEVKPTYGDDLVATAESHRHGDEEYRYAWDGSKWAMISLCAN